MQAKSLASSTCLHSKLRGIFDIREDWVLELRQRSELLVVYVQSEHNIADLLTKSHTTARYQQLLGKIRDKANIRHLQIGSYKLHSLRLLLELHSYFHGPGRPHSFNASKKNGFDNSCQ